jgi:hypothetical protein
MFYTVDMGTLNHNADCTRHSHDNVQVVHAVLPETKNHTRLVISVHQQLTSICIHLEPT